MVRLAINELSQAYYRKYVFKNVSLERSTGSHMAILGSNGSGKSTLLKTLSGALMPFSGSVVLEVDGQVISQEEQYRYISLAAPYLELIEEYTLIEFLRFYEQLKPWRADFTAERVIEEAYLEEAKDRDLRYFSSGMKQRVKLALAFFTDTPLVFLDEPLSNLDRKGTEWYLRLVEKYTSGRLIFVCSNETEEEYAFCTDSIRIENYK